MDPNVAWMGRSRLLLVLLSLLLLSCTNDGAAAGGDQISDPVLVELTPSILIRSYDSIPSSVSWRILAEYTSSSSKEGDEVLDVPILFFPSPGIATFDVGSHPCVSLLPSPCCLLDFADQYTSVSFYRFLHSQRSWLNRTSCGSAGIDLRLLVRTLYSQGMVDSMVTGALDGISNTSVTLVHQQSSQIEVIIPHRAMKSLLSTSSGDSTSRLLTFVGVMWLKTRPSSAGLIAKSLEVSVSQTAVTLNLAGQFVLEFAAPSGCSMTPQVTRLTCRGLILFKCR